MPNTAQVNVNETDLTISVTPGIKGINAVQGITKRGPYGRPDLLIKSWEEFVRIYGGEMAGNEFPTLCKRALDIGSQLRVNRVGHYTTISDKTTLTALKSSPTTPFQNAIPETLFTLLPKNPGVDTNDLIVTIKAASNGDASYFDLVIDHVDESALTETYKNLKVEASIVANASFLSEIALNSELMVPGYVNTSALSGTLRPVNLVHTYSGGSDGGAIISTDYTGDSAGSTGFYSFDDIDDCLSISAPAMSTTAIHTAGTAYVEGRKDMVYYAHLASLTANGLATERAALNIDSAYVAFFAGGLRIISSISGSEINISELGDIIGISGRVDADPQYGPWWSIAGDNRGKINNALGVVSNFGSAGKFNDLNLLANRQINVVLVENGKIKLSGNFTAQLKQTRLSYLSIRKLLITIKKDLKPTLKAFIEEPNDPLTWKAIFRAVKPYLDDLASEEKRALHSYRWEGDQNVSKADDVVINKKSDIDQGKYKAKLFTKEIVSLQDIEVNIILTPSSVEFEEVQQNS